MVRSTGDERFDELLGGGVPDGRALLVRGPPGVGTRRFGGGFLAAGLDAGERCLYVSTSQPRRVAGDVLDNPDAAGLTVADAVRAEQGVTYRTGEGRETLSYAGFLDRISAPEYDRVVVDGTADLLALAPGRVEGLAGLSAAVERFAEGGSAAVLTGPADGEAGVDRRVAGVVDCWREEVAGDARAFARVRKLQEREYDTRRRVLHSGADGVTVAAREWATHPNALPTGIDSFDGVTGGFVQGGTTVFEHDGEADHWPFTAAACARAIEHGRPVVFVTAPGTLRGRVNDLLEPRVGHVRQLMADRKLFLVDPVSRSPSSPELATLPDETVLLEEVEGSLQAAVRKLIAELGDERVVGVLEHAAIEHLIDEAAARHLFYWASGTIQNVPGELTLVLSADRTLAGERLGAFFTSVADQVVRTWRGTDELQYLSVPKSPAGTPGHTRVVEPLADPPYVRLR